MLRKEKWNIKSLKDYYEAAKGAIDKKDLSYAELDDMSESWHFINLAFESVRQNARAGLEKKVKDAATKAAEDAISQKKNNIDLEFSLSIDLENMLFFEAIADEVSQIYFDIFFLEGEQSIKEYVEEGGKECPFNVGDTVYLMHGSVDEFGLVSFTYEPIKVDRRSVNLDKCGTSYGTFEVFNIERQKIYDIGDDDNQCVLTLEKAEAIVNYFKEYKRQCENEGLI